MASSSAVGKVSREEFRRQKDLDAARKAGTAPAELDQEGRPINPHIPRKSASECTLIFLNQASRIYLSGTMVLGPRTAIPEPSTFGRDSEGL